MTLKTDPFNRAQEVLSKLPLAVLAENEHRKISFANTYFCDLFGIQATPEQLQGLDCGGLADQSKDYFTKPNDFLAYVHEAITLIKPIHDVELQLIDGRFLSATYQPYYKQDVFAGHIWIYNDITERKKAELALEKQKAFSAEILDSLPADVAIFDQDHKYIYLNRTAIKDPEIRNWIIGKDDFEYCKFRNRDIAVAEVRRHKFLEALNTQQQIEWEDEVLNPDGSIDAVLRRLNPLFDENHQLKFMVGYGININQVKQKEEELRKSELKYKTVLNHLQEIIFRLNDEGYIEFLNPAWEKITGYPIEFSIGKKLSYFTEPDQHPEIEKNIQSLAKGNKTDIFTLLKLTSKTKTKIYFETYASVLNLEGEKSGIWGTLTNITEKRKAENELIKSISKERDLNELKSRFVNMVSHEIRTPMAGILSSVELLEIISKGDPTLVESKSEKHHTRIKSQIRRITDLMNDVLMLGKIDAGKISYHPVEVDPVAIVNEIIEQNFNKKEINRKIEIITSGTKRLCKLDINLIKHILSNLISNALKYSVNKPDPTLKLIFNETNIVIEVIDYGIGVPAAEQKNLFSAFNRASNTRNIEGTGLGLVVIKNFVDIQGGKITFKSVENVGTTFKVSLPG